MSKIVAVIKRLFVQNWKMKLIALIFAFILWSFVIAEDNPYKTKTFRDFPVTYTAADELRQKDLTTSEPLAQLLSSVTVTAQARADALQYLNENMIQVTVDLSSIDGIGEYTLRVEGKSSLNDTTVNVEPSTVTVNVEEIVPRSVPVDVQLTGEQEGFYYGEPVLEDETIEIRGARSKVESVAKAICKIDVMEFYHESGERISEHNERESQKTSPYNFAYFAVSYTHLDVYKRQGLRCDARLFPGTWHDDAECRIPDLRAD